MKKIMLALIMCMSMQTIQPIERIIQAHKKTTTAFLTILMGSILSSMLLQDPDYYQDRFEELIISKIMLALSGMGAWGVIMHCIWCLNR